MPGFVGKSILRATALLMLSLAPIGVRAEDSAVGGDAAWVAGLLRQICLREPLDKSVLDPTGDGIVTAADARTFLMSVAGSIENPEDMAKALSGSLLGDRFLEKFSYNGAMGDGNGNYRSGKVSVSLTKHTETVSDRKTTWYVADIYIRDIDCFRTEYTKGRFGETEQCADMARDCNAVIAITGDFFSHHDRKNRGLCIRNGAILRDSLDKSRDVCVLYRDGTMETYLAGSVDIKEIESRDPWQAWSFGPSLLDSSGHAKTEFNTNVSARNPRSAIGYYEPGHYCFVVVDGRQKNYSYGMTVEDLSKLFENLGCKVAYNLDGGDTAVMATAAGEINRRSGAERECSDILYIFDNTQEKTGEEE